MYTRLGHIPQTARSICNYSCRVGAQAIEGDLVNRLGSFYDNYRLYDSKKMRCNL